MQYLVNGKYVLLTVLEHQLLLFFVFILGIILIVFLSYLFSYINNIKQNRLDYINSLKTKEEITNYLEYKNKQEKQ